MLHFECEHLFARNIENTLICTAGFEYQISNNMNWGYGEPIVTKIIPGSAAEKAGLKENDIIMEVDSKATYLRDIELIDEWINGDYNSPILDITVRNISNSFLEMKIEKDCKAINALSEADLLSICSPYSMENSRKEQFSMPIKIKTLNKHNYDYSDFHTFDFLPSNNELHPQVQEIISKSLENRGLKRSKKDPDIYIECSYALKPEDKFRSVLNSNKCQLATCDNNRKRYNFETQKIETLPIADDNTPRSLYSFDIKINIYENKLIEPGVFTKIWEAELEEDFVSKISLKKILDIYTPLLIMQYPYTEDCSIVTFEVDFNNYLYTGISYENNNLNKIINVEDNSPAYNAGIRTGDFVEKIQNKELSENLNNLKLAIYAFTLNTLSLRDQEKCFAQNEEESYKALWNIRKEADIKKSFDNKKYKAAFSYLFDFEKYINPEYDGILNFQISSGENKRTVQIKPIIKKNNRIRIIR